MENIYKDLLELLKKYDGLFAENGSLHKNKVQELSLKNDRKLIELLLNSPACKKHFFFQTGKVTIFDKDKFIGLIYNKKFLSDSYTRFSEKIGLASEKEFIVRRQEVVLNWPYKDCILEGGMTKEDKGRDEIFWNEVIAPEHITRLKSPKAFMNGKKIDAKGSKQLKNFTRSPDGVIKDNLIIKGNNLLALHSLEEQFSGKVKLIYLDPPYNTGKDGFKYNDRFNHSTWLTFMKNRLQVARKLLRNDGVIFIQCDDNERSYLNILMDEVFGRTNFICNISIKTASVNGFKIYGNKPVRVKETIFMYCKRITEYKYIRAYTRQAGRWDDHYSKFFDKDNDRVLSLKDVLKKEGIMNSTDRLGELDIDDKKFKNFYIRNKDRIFQTGAHKNEKYRELSLRKKGKVVVDEKSNHYYNGRMVSFLSASIHTVAGEECLGLALTDFWSDIDFNNVQNEGGIGFTQGRKPEALIKRMIETSTEPGEIVLDFFLGSGTTAAVAHKMGRQYIGIEQMDYVEDVACERLKKVVQGEKGGISKLVKNRGGGGGYFVYMELAEWNQKWVKEIKEAKSTKQLQGLWGKIKEHAFLSYRIDVKKVDASTKEFKSLPFDDQKKFLLDCLDANHLYINFSEIEDEEHGMEKSDKELSRSFYVQ